MNFVIQPDDFASAQCLGTKAAVLATLQRAGQPIPSWFAVSPDAFYTSLNGQRECVETAWDSAQIRALTETLRPTREICEEITQALAALAPNGETVAVRSSALDEDGAQFSFAGQLESYLFIRPDDVAQHVAKVWRSAFSDRISAYRSQHGLSRAPGAPAVLIQRMVHADVAGVAFSADPVSGRRGVAVVTALYGAGCTLVSGEQDADTFYVDREERIVDRTIVEKRLAYYYDANDPSGMGRVEIPYEPANKACLSDEPSDCSYLLVRRVAAQLERPQDIEWAIEDGHLYLLQSRPITSLAKIGDPDGMFALWDNSNISESYGGVTTPLTFSFARRAYEHVYRQMCRIARVPDAIIAAHDDVFGRMLGLIHGRVYYNLISWYRLLAMLPGFSLTHRFMEQMMGVRDRLPEQLRADLDQSRWHDGVRAGFRLVRMVGTLIGNHFYIKRHIRRFYQRLNSALEPTRPELADMRVDELAAYYRLLERKLLSRWDAPLINDFLAMIFFGLLGRMVERWFGDRDIGLQNDLLCGEVGIVSAEPAVRMREMSEMATYLPEFTALLCNGPVDEIVRGIAQVPQFRTEYEAYVDKFGDRCLDELKLESVTLHDDPLPLLRSVGLLARANAVAKANSPCTIQSALRSRAEQRVREVLGWRPQRHAAFRWVLRHARITMRDRENLRFERTRLFGRVRRIFVEIGRRFYALGLLDAPRDIFYLDISEILGFIEGTTTCTDLRGLVVVRKREFSSYVASPAPADRFETHGAVHHGNSFHRPDDMASVNADNIGHGVGCCPGIVSGSVRVITDPRNAVLQGGEILVAERTDPGWVTLLPFAAGLIVERGSLLSHSAIVAREMGIPTVVSLTGARRWLRNGDWVELDGSSGAVRCVKRMGEEESG